MQRRATGILIFAKAMCDDYYVVKPERKCGPWVDMNAFTIRVKGVVHHDLSPMHKVAIKEGLKGHRHSFATRQKIAKALRGRRKSRKHRKKISRALKDREVRDLTRGRMSEAARSRNFIIISSPGRAVTR